MSTPYKAELLRLAQQELPFLQSDLQNASTVYALQSCCQRMFNALSYVIYHILTEEQSGAPSQKPAPAPQAAPQRAVKAPPVVTSTPRLPPPPFISQPNPSASPVSVPEAQGATIQPGVTNVIIGQQGTTVIAPSGVQTLLPPGEPVDLAASTGADAEPPPAPEGVQQVILPRGGAGLTPDVLAALANRQGGPAPSTDDEVQEA